MTRSEPVPTTPPPGPVSYGPGVLDDFADDDGSGRRWWLAVLVGLVMVGLGLWMLANLIESVVVLALVIGVSLITGGILDALVLDRPYPRWAAGLEGLLLVATGSIVLAWPDITLYVLAVTGGLALGLGGVIHLVIALFHRDDPSFNLELGLGVVGLVVGGMVLAWPEATLVVLALMFGIRAIVVGCLAMGAGWQMRRRHAGGAASAAG